MVEQSEPAAGPLMGRRVGEPADPLPSGKEQCGAAQWPRLRRHLADKLGTPSRKRIESGIYNDSSGCCAR